MTNRLNLVVCENLLPEFAAAVRRLDCDDVAVTAYPSLCDKKDAKREVAEQLKQLSGSDCDCALFSGENCDVLKITNRDMFFKVVTSRFCAAHYVDQHVLQYIISKKDYVVSSGWLRNWRKHLERMGFDQPTARGFYKDFCRELVFFDLDGGSANRKEMEALSEYLDIPHQIIHAELNTVDRLVRSVVEEWRLAKRACAAEAASAEASARCAEYASVMEILGRMSSCQDRGDAIEKLRGIFTMLMGASEAIFYDSENNFEGLPEEALSLTRDTRKKYVCADEGRRFYVSVATDETVYGIVSASGFMFPQYIQRYLNFAVGMSRVCGLVFSNIDNYAKLAKSQNALKLKSYQDPLTGLKNRAFYYDQTAEGMAENSGKFENMAVFSFDIDGLKYVNDHFGHLEGDKLIVAASSILRKSFRESDIVVRMGGDEFLALVPECADRETAERIKGRLCVAIEDYNSSVEEAHLKVGLSVGYAIRGENTETAQAMLNRADVVMYKDKASKHMVH